MPFEADRSGLSKEDQDGAERADKIISATIDTLKMLFPRSEVTILVRNLDHPDMKLLGTTDDINEVVRVMQEAEADWEHSRLHGVEGGRN